MREKGDTEGAEEAKKAYMAAREESDDTTGVASEEKVSSALIDKVDAMLQELEKEIDDVDARIENRWQLLDSKLCLRQVMSGRSRKLLYWCYSRGMHILHYIPALQVIGPLGQQWLHWLGGNVNVSRQFTKEEIKKERMFRRLETSPRVVPEELLIYAVSETLAIQPEPIVDMLTEIVVIYNRMADMRCQYLFKRLDGVNGKQMSLILKKLQEDKEEAQCELKMLEVLAASAPHYLLFSLSFRSSYN